MAILQSCCCWRSLRKGSYASAIYTASYFSVTIVIVSKFLHEERLYLTGNMTQPISDSFLEPETISPTTMVFNMVVLVCASLGFFSCLLLMYGLFSDKRVFLIPWIFIVMMTTMVDLAHSLYLFALETMSFNPMTAILFTLDFFLLCLNVYCLLCVVSQYQEYKAGRGTAGHDELDRRARIKIPPVRYVAQPTGTSCLSTRRAATYHETRASPTQSPTAPHPTLPVGDPRMRSNSKHVQFGGNNDCLHVNWRPPDIARGVCVTESSKSLVVDTELLLPASPTTPNSVQFFDPK
ncbi:uncharacterized protein LOC128996031 isoform X2 [Macrosteles quadrilineatus]|uniref:uncharacterized protein LOC128996031 isoform X2 n=1 Tax=Macrosteles quadrilineatus TaxID=74068 RepID=UPI0023E15F4C|nr:uncharacterized protein LOC128996031 isoform X2 [Macrosteles quadrilineatus]